MSYDFTPTYKRNPEGRLEETQASIKRNIAATFGFKYDKIILLEADYMICEGSEENISYCRACVFSVNGYGYWTNFNYINRADSYDD